MKSTPPFAALHHGDAPLLLPNAWYWLGESYYVTQNYELGVDAFRTLLDDHPGSRKEADALLKLGYCQQELGDRNAARSSLQEVMRQFPDTTAARLASQRLGQLQ